MPGHILEAPQAAFNAEESATQGRVGSMYQHTQCSIFVFLFIFKFDIKCIEACSVQPDYPQEQENQRTLQPMGQFRDLFHFVCDVYIFCWYSRGCTEI